MKYLRSKYRLPIEICPSVTGLSINQESISRFKRDKTTDAKDRDYLMYDFDRDDILERLQKIKGATIIASNPCLELWYLLHFVDQKTEISSEQCLVAVKKHLPNYKKGEVNGALQKTLSDKQELAIKRSESLHPRENPSCEIPLFLADLEGASK